MTKIDGRPKGALIDPSTTPLASLQKVRAAGARRRPFLTLCGFSPKRHNLFQNFDAPATSFTVPPEHFYSELRDFS